MAEAEALPCIRCLLGPPPRQAHRLLPCPLILRSQSPALLKGSPNKQPVLTVLAWEDYITSSLPLSRAYDWPAVASSSVSSTLTVSPGAGDTMSRLSGQSSKNITPSRCP